MNCDSCVRGCSSRCVQGEFGFYENQILSTLRSQAKSSASSDFSGDSTPMLQLPSDPIRAERKIGVRQLLLFSPPDETTPCTSCGTLIVTQRRVGDRIESEYRDKDGCCWKCARGK